MERMSVRFTQRQIAAIRREARLHDTSDAAIVREAVDASLPTAMTMPAVEWIARVRSVGPFSSGRRDGSEAHDSDMFEQ